MEKITQIICRYYGLKLRAIKGKSKSQEVVKPRHISIYFCIMFLYPEFSFSQIGDFFNCDHSSVIYANTKTKERRKLYYGSELDELEGRIRMALNKDLKPQHVREIFYLKFIQYSEFSTENKQLFRKLCKDNYDDLKLDDKRLFNSLLTFGFQARWDFIQTSTLIECCENIISDYENKC